MTDAAGQNNDQGSTLPIAVAVGRGFLAVVADCDGVRDGCANTVELVRESWFTARQVVDAQSTDH
jgi:hypothetical protein